MWTPQFGYIWVSCENWGYLPYSCGSWNFYNGFGWGWSVGTGGCTPWWRRGTYAGWNVGHPPSWYHPIPRPILRSPRGRNPIPVINVHRNPEGGPNQLPQRGRNNPVVIAGREVEPMRRLPGYDSYVRSTSGFVYHPSNGNQSRRDGGQVENGRGGSDHPVVVNRPVYNHNEIGDGYTRHANPEPGRTYVPPSQGNGSPDRNNTPERNNNMPGPVYTQPGRVIVPPSQNRPEPGRTYTPPPQQRPQPPQQQPQPSDSTRRHRNHSNRGLNQVVHIRRLQVSTIQVEQAVRAAARMRVLRDLRVAVDLKVHRHHPVGEVVPMVGAADQFTTNFDYLTFGKWIINNSESRLALASLKSERHFVNAALINESD